MSLITDIIEQRAYEKIGEKLLVIIGDELNNQATLDLNDKAIQNVTVYRERIAPFNHTDLPAINISFAGGSYNNRSALQADGNYQFHFDCYQSSTATNTTVENDQLANTKLQRLMGVVWAILMNPSYTNLGLSAPDIGSRGWSNMQIGEPEKLDATRTVMGRLTLDVRAPETIQAIDVPQIAGQDTTVNIALTPQGYQYVS